jgi:hypothetical protein
VKAIPAPAEDTAGVRLTSAAKVTVNAKPEALEPWAGHGRDMVSRQHAKEGECPLEALSRDDTTRYKHKHALPIQKGAAEGMAGHGFKTTLQTTRLSACMGSKWCRERARSWVSASAGEIDTAPQGGSTDSECTLKAPPQGAPNERAIPVRGKPIKCEPNRSPREVATKHEGVLAPWEYAREGEHWHKAPPPMISIKHERKCKRARQRGWASPTGCRTWIRRSASASVSCHHEGSRKRACLLLWRKRVLEGPS